MILATVGAVSYLAGPPTVHALHGRERTALQSLAFRVGLPLAAALIIAPLYAAGWNGCSACTYSIPAIAGAALLTPVILDAAVFAYDDRRVSTLDQDSRRRATALAFAGSGRIGLGFTGSF
jgi:hypothetical protein